ncbi:MAG TPA: DNA alkylation repair protein [Verrucomicrobiales bacterium]|nr:DNA alkylation repair protein [Verrucomicrobiales bacterium]
MTLEETMSILAAKGNAATKRTYMRHGAPEPLFGVRIGDLKPVQKLIKGDQNLAMQLYATGNSDAMYLAGLVANGGRMPRALLNRWAKQATWHLISGCTVPWVASEHPQGFEIAMKWIEASEERVAVSGWSTLAAILAVTPDDELPIREIASLLARVAKTIRSSPNRVRYAMNNFVICCGTYVAPLAGKALAVAGEIGPVDVDMGNTDCQVPDAVSSIHKSRRGLPVAPKRKTTRC